MLCKQCTGYFTFYAVQLDRYTILTRYTYKTNVD